MTAERRILVVEDARKTAETVRRYLEHAGFAVDIEGDGRAGLLRAREREYMLVILDIMLPGFDGWTVCERLRAESATPILMLSARSTEDDRVAGLDLGADDYLIKPFSPRELVARVRAILRRRAPDVLKRRRQWGPLRVDLDDCTAHRDDTALPLTDTERRLLYTLLGAPGRVFTRDELIERALGRAFEGTARTIDAHVRNLRTKVESDPARPELIATVFGVGYRLATDRVASDTAASDPASNQRVDGS